MDKITPKKLVEFIVKESNIDSNKIKGVEVYENFSFMSVPFAEAEVIIDIFKKVRKGRKPLVEKAKERSSSVKENAENKEDSANKKRRTPRKDRDEKSGDKKSSDKSKSKSRAGKKENKKQEN